MQVSFQFTPTKEDYIQSSRNFIANIKVSVIVILVLFVLEIWLGNVAFSAPEWETRPEIWFGVLALPAFSPFLAVLIFFFVPSGSAIGKQIEKNAQWTSPVFWQMDDTQITTRNEFAESKVVWSFFQRAIEYDRFYLLIHAINKQAYTFIPKRVFDSPEHEAAFRALIEQKLELQNQIKLKKVILPLIKWAGILLLSAMTISSWISLLLQVMRYR